MSAGYWPRSRHNKEDRYYYSPSYDIPVPAFIGRWFYHRAVEKNRKEDPRVAE